MDSTLEALFTGPSLIAAFLIYANFNHVNVRANKWFGTFVFFIFLIQLESALSKAHYFDSTPAVEDFLSLISFVIAPVFYFSIVYFIAPDRKWRVRDNLHFLFGFILLILTVLTLFIHPEKVKSKEDKQLEAIVVQVFMAVFCVQVLLYCTMAYYKINKYQKNLVVYAANLEKNNLGWLKRIAACVLIICIVWLTDGLFQISVTSAWFDSFSNADYFSGICYITYHALKQKEIFPYTQVEKKDIEEIIEEGETEEAKRKLISDEKLAGYRQKLAELMNTEKPHLDYDISLVKLATRFNVSPHQLSYIINNGFNENFFQFINRYRVEHAMKMILDPTQSHLSFMGIAFESGFNSKTVFNTTFKRITGKTPSEFKKNHNALL